MVTDKNTAMEKARRNKGFTQKQLAEATGTTRLWIHAIESQGAEPSLAVAKKIAEVLDVTLDELF